MSDTEWWTPQEEAEIEIKLPRRAEIEEIKIKWWGLSRARKFSIQMDSSQVFEFSETEKPDYNSWRQINLKDVKKKVQTIKLLLKKGVSDPWKMNKKLGIRQILIFGKMEEDKYSIETFILQKFSSCLQDVEAKLFVPFLLQLTKQT